MFEEMVTLYWFLMGEKQRGSIKHMAEACHMFE